MVVGDLVTVTKSQTTGIENGTLGLVVNISRIGKKEYIYFIYIFSYGGKVPLWRNEIEVLNRGDRGSC